MININWNDPFYGVMVVLVVLLILAGYVAFFGEISEDEPTKHKKAHAL